MSRTKGDWCLDENGPRYAINTVGYPEKAGSKHIAMVNVSYKLTPEESLANARLIAAAPDLLAVCEAALDWMTMGIDHVDGEPMPRDILVAAIAKTRSDE